MTAPAHEGGTQRGNMLRQAILFIAAGGLNTAFGYGAFAALLWLSGSKLLAVVLGTLAGIAFNFGTYGAVFARTGSSRLPHFIAFYLLLLSANIILLRLFTSSGMNPYLAQAIFIGLSTPISFVTMRNLIFPDPSPASS